MKASELARLMHERMLAYRFLARVYRAAPDSVFLSSLLAMDTKIETPLQATLMSMQSCDPQQLRIDLAAEYNRVFLGMGPDPIAPYESVYTSPDHLLMQESRDEMLGLYRSEALFAHKGTRIPEDHLSMELDFMAYLCEQAVWAARKGDQKKTAEYLQKQRGLLKGHLLVWVFDLCRDMEERVCSSFYKSICAITVQQLEFDRDLLSIDLEGC